MKGLFLAHKGLRAADAGASPGGVIAAPRGVRARIPRVAPYVVLVAAFAHNLHYSWLRWGDPVVDCGRELEVAREIAAGQVLYVDVRWFYGPLAPYVNAALYAVLGVRAGVLMAAGAASAALMAILLYHLACRVTGRLPATLAATAFLYLCAFGNYYLNGIFNWVLPYSYAATYGMLAATASLFLLVRHVQEGRARDLQLSVACLALAALAKLEAFIPAAAAHVVFVLTEHPRLGAYAAAAAAAFGIFGLFWARLGYRLLDDYLWVTRSPSMRSILLLHMGLADVRQSLGSVGRSGLWLAAVVLLVWGVSFLARRRRMPPSVRRACAGLCAAGAAFTYSRPSVFEQLRMLPVLLAALAVYSVVRWWRVPAERRSMTPRLLLVVFALACLARMPLATGAFHYGFYLLPVPLVAFVVWWFCDLPGWLPERPVRLVTWAGVGLLAAVIATHYRASRELYDRHSTLVHTARGHMYVLDDLMGFPTGPAYAQTVYLLSRYPPASRVLVIPMGVGLTFLAGLTSVCGMDSFTPPELAGPFEDRLLACLEAAPPDLVVGVSVNLAEYGVRAFGEDYAQRTAAWIAERYEPLATFGPRGYVFVLRRRAGLIPSP